jgi:hypothetical protein
MKLKPKCCKKYKKKAEACKNCPVMALLGPKARRKRLAKARRRLAKAA